MTPYQTATQPPPRGCPRRRAVSALVAAWLLVAAWPVHAAIYQWISADGSIGLTDDPGRIPEQYRATATLYQGAFSELASVPALEAPPPTDPAPKKTPASRAVPGAAAGPDTDVNGHDQTWWQERAEALRQQRTTAQKERETAEQQYNELRYFGRETKEELRNQESLRLRLQELADALKQIEQQLNRDLPEEARRAGAPPGWLR